MESGDGKLALTTTDLEMQISSSIDFTGPELRVLLPAQAASIIKAMPGNNIKLEFGDGKVVITAGEDGESKLQLSTLDPVDFPRFKQSEEGADTISIAVTVGEFKKALRQIIFAVSTDINKQNFTRVNFGLFNNELHLTATDTYRLATTVCPATRISGSDKDILVPAKPLHEFLRFAGKLSDSETVKITGRDKSIAFEAGPIQVMARLGTETFPDIQKLIPTVFSGTLTVNTNAFRQALERALILTEKGGTSVANFSTGAPSLVGIDLCISVTSAHGSLKERINTEYSGDGFDTTLNARFLLEWLKVCEGDQIQLQHNGVHHPCVALDSASPSLKYLVLPIRRN
jgi:DNA polymerase-3 subunit beta